VLLLQPCHTLTGCAGAAAKQFMPDRCLFSAWPEINSLTKNPSSGKE